MKIKEIDIPHGLMLCPMAGVSDRAFRLICAENGAEYAVTEMVSAKALDNIRLCLRYNMNAGYGNNCYNDK